MRGSRGQHDFAYGCYALVGLTVLAMSVYRASYTDGEWSAGAGGLLLIALPLLLASCAAALVGLAMSFQLAQHRPLVVLAWATIAVCTLGFGGVWPASQYILPITYGASVLAMCGWWFLLERNRVAR
jgi:hypothetical protein